MRKIGKHLLSILLISVLLTSLSLPNAVFASNHSHNCEISDLPTYAIGTNEGQEWEWEKEVIVEVGCEEDTLTYPRNPKYKYTFIYTTPSLTRAVCYMCGGYGLGLVTRKSQYGCTPKDCPVVGAALGTDLFNTWYHYTRERCTSCGYSSEEWRSQITYTARCDYGNNPPSGEWEVKEEYTMAKGYDPHQYLGWWLYKELATLPYIDRKRYSLTA